jgi:CRP/FNR family transcriptional regulator, cyclic AMP receptor protein
VARMRSLLSQISILRGCSVVDLDGLGCRARANRYEPGAPIAQVGAVADSLCLIAYGRVRLASYGENGRELVLEELGAGQLFGEEALGAERRRRASAIAVDEVTIVSIDAAGFASFLRDHPAVALRFAMELSSKVARAHEQIAALGLLSVEDRLIRTLERLSRKQGYPCADGVMLDDRPTHEEIGSEIAACRETVTRTFQALSRRGLVVQRGSSLLLTRTALERLSPTTTST